MSQCPLQAARIYHNRAAFHCGQRKTAVQQKGFEFIFCNTGVPHLFYRKLFDKILLKRRRRMMLDIIYEMKNTNYMTSFQYNNPIEFARKFAVFPYFFI